MPLYSGNLPYRCREHCHASPLIKHNCLCFVRLSETSMEKVRFKKETVIFDNLFPIINLFVDDFQLDHIIPQTFSIKCGLLLKPLFPFSIFFKQKRKKKCFFRDLLFTIVSNQRALFFVQLLNVYDRKSVNVNAVEGKKHCLPYCLPLVALFCLIHPCETTGLKSRRGRKVRKGLLITFR